MASGDNFRKKIQKSDNTVSMIYGGFSDKINSEIDTETNKIRNIVKEINAAMVNATGGDPVEYLTQLAYNSGKSNTKGNSSKNNKKPPRSVGDMMRDVDLTLLSQVYADTRNKRDLCNDYDKLYQLIPQLSQCIDVIVANIMSPDDFTKVSLSIFYDNKILGTGETTSAQSCIDHLNKIYREDRKAKHVIKKTCIYGEYFISCISQSSEFNRLLTESEVLEKQVDISKAEIFNESEILQLKGELDTDKLCDVAKSVLDNIVFDDSGAFLYQEEAMLREDFNLNKDGKYSDSDLNDESKSNKITDQVFKNGFLNFDDDILDSTNNLNGSFIKHLETRNVVELNIGQTVFGYYYVETEDDGSKNTANINSTGSIFSPGAFYKTTTDVPITNGQHSGLNPMDLDPKTRLIMDVIMRNIGKKIGKRHVTNNAQFRNIIYEILRKEDFYRKKIKITFLKPSEVIKFTVDEDENGRGHSKFEKILFTAKLYLSVLICNMMLKLSRSADHRTFYIETGLSEDIEGTISSLMRDFKAKEIHMNDLDTLDSIFRVIGQFSDYYIPMTNGEKAMDIDTIPGMNTEMDNDWTEYLKKTMISGMNVPASYLNYHDEVEFAKSLSMVNGNFLRTIVIDQGPLGESYTKFYRLMYQNEFGETKDKTNVPQDASSHITKLTKKQRKEDTLQINKLEVRFPSPASLNLTNILDQLGNATQVAEAIVNTYLGQNYADEPKKTKATYAVVKKLVSFDIDEYKEIIEEALLDEEGEDIISNDSDMAMDDGMGGDTNSMNMNMDDGTQGPQNEQDDMMSPNFNDTEENDMNVGTPTGDENNNDGLDTNNNSQNNQDTTDYQY